MEAHLIRNCAPDPSTEFWSLISNINDKLFYAGNSKWPKITGHQQQHITPVHYNKGKLTSSQVTQGGGQRCKQSCKEYSALNNSVH